MRFAGRTPRLFFSRAIFLVAPLIAAALFVPYLLAALTVAAFLAQLSLVLISTLGRSANPAGRFPVDTTGRRQRIFLSVHVPACREPPEILIGTLASLAKQVDAGAHEVIVIVNNTPDPMEWQPVADWCAAQGAPFRFVHREGVLGAKAGALNIALALADPATSHIVTVDADYHVSPTFLKDVQDQVRHGTSSFFQFPQAYRSVQGASHGIARELEDYFLRHANAANRANAMLLTGTLSVISKEALVKVGGWPTFSCTEDAALGTLLIDAGYHGVYVDKVVGPGLMPFDVAALHKQRLRWASGNARCWRCACPGFYGAGQLPRSPRYIGECSLFLNWRSG